MISADRPLRRLLVAGAHADPALDRLGRDLQVVDRTELVTAARHHRVGAGLAHHLERAGLEPVPELAQDRSVTLLGHLRTLAELGGLQQVLDGAGVRWAVVKGPVLAACYGRPDLRGYTDLDLLVDRRQLAVAMDALEAGGATLLDRNWTMVHDGRRGELSMRLLGGVPLDLHWFLVNDPRLRREVGLSEDRILARLSLQAVGDLRVPTPCAADHLLYTAVHATLAGGQRLYWLADVDRIVRAHDLDWDEVVSVADQSSLRVLLGSMLARARQALGTPVPAAVVGRLAPAHGWRGLVQVIDAWRPPERAHRPGRSGQIVVRSTRGTTAASVAGLAMALRRRPARRGLPGDLARLRAEPEDPRSRASLFDELRAGAR